MAQHLTFRLDRRFPVAVVRLSGALVPAAGATVRAAVLAALVEEPTSVIVDLAGLTATDGRALPVLAEAARQAAAWPGARLLLCCPPAGLAPALAAATGVPDLPVHSSREAALANAATDPVPRRLQLRLEPTIHAPRAARRLAVRACASWDLPGATGATAILASELVTNAVRHAGTGLELRLTLREEQLRVSVHDLHPGRLPALSRSRGGGRGLLVVDTVAAAWGDLPVPDGKIVWARLPVRRITGRPPPATRRRRCR